MNRSGSEGFPTLYAPRGLLVRRVFPGVPRAPFGRTLPESAAARLFNPWAAFFGPLHALLTGLWRKSLVGFLLLELIKTFMPSDPEAAALDALLREHYALGLWQWITGIDPALHNGPIRLDFWQFFPTACLYASAFALLAGRKLAGCVFLLMAFFPLFIHERFVPGLDLGIAPSMLWLLSRDVWPLLAGIAFYALLTARLAVLGVVAGLAAGFFWLGLPLMTISPLDVATSAFATLWGAMSVLDQYRRHVLLQRFWW